MPSGNFRTFKWDLVKRRAALHVADGIMTDMEIAAEAGISDRQLRTWKRNPIFAAKVQRLQQDAADELADFALTQKRQRMAVYHDLLERQLTVLFERAAEYEELARAQAKIAPLGGDLLNQIGKQRVPAGGASGLIVRQVKQIGQLLAEEFSVDVPLVKSILATLEQIAKEAGQWETTIKHGGSVAVTHRHTVDLSRLSDEELAQLAVLAAKVEAGQVTS